MKNKNHSKLANNRLSLCALPILRNQVGNRKFRVVRKRALRESFLWCNGCSSQLPSVNFYFNKSRKKYFTKCKKCCYKTQVLWRKKNPDKVLEEKRRYRKKYPEKIRIYQNRYQKNNLNKISAYSKEYRKKHPNKRRAQDAVRKAVQRKKIKKPEICEKCEKKVIRKNLAGHHVDYNFRLKVEWLCMACHRKLHANQGIS